MSAESPSAGGAHMAGIGIDAVDIDRFRRVLGRRPSLAERVFTEAERADAADPVTRPGTWRLASRPKRP